MQPTIPLRRHAALGLLPLSALLAGCAAGSGSGVTITRELVVDHVVGSSIRVETTNGGVDLVVDRDRTDVHVSLNGRVAGARLVDAERRAADATIELVRSADGTLEIRPSYPEPPHQGDQASLVVTVPDAHNASLRTTNGRIVAADLDGSLEATTTNGAVRAQSIGGAVNARTVNGSISAVATGGEIALSTTNGSVSVDEAVGAVSVQTTNGSVAVTECRGPLGVSTTNGSVRISLHHLFRGSLDLQTSNGRIILRDTPIGDVDMRGGHAVFVMTPDGPVSRVRTTNGRISVTGGAPN